MEKPRHNMLRYTGWWLSPTPLKNMSSSLGIIIPNMESHKIHVPNHQSVYVENLSYYIAKCISIASVHSHMFGESHAQTSQVTSTPAIKVPLAGLW